MKSFRLTVAKNVKKLLEEQSKTAEKLAYETGISKGFLSEFLNGKKDITLDYLQKICEGLDVTPENLFQ